MLKPLESFYEDEEYNYASVKNRFDKDILPHLIKDNSKKVIFIGMCVKKLLDTFLGLRAFNDRDHYANKRVDLAGQILLIFFRYRIIHRSQQLIDTSIHHIRKNTSNNQSYTTTNQPYDIDTYHNNTQP